jgi:hypothetical protein
LWRIAQRDCIPVGGEVWNKPGALGDIARDTLAAIDKDVVK